MGAGPKVAAQETKITPESSAPSNSSSRIVYDGEGDVIPLYESREYLLYWDWLFRFWIYFDTMSHGVTYLSAFGFFVGGMFFMVGTFSALSPSVQATQREGSCGLDAYSWWTVFPYMCGDVVWLFACYNQIMESLNTDYDHRTEMWEANKCRGPKPRYKVVGIKMSWDWWGAFFYFFGVGMYTTAQALVYVSLCPGHELSDTVYTWFVDYFYLIAGILFFLAGTFYAVTLGSPWLLPSILVPFNKASLCSMMWWVVWLYFWGGACFLMSGIFLYWYSPNNMKLSLRTYQIENSIGFGGGAFLFFIGALLLLMRQSRGRCRPSFAEVNTNCDLSVHGGSGYKTMVNQERLRELV